MKQFIVPAGGGLENLRVDDVAEPGAPGPGEIRVQVKASSLNFHDYMVISGSMPPDEDRVPLADASGVVAEVGEGVDEFAVGDRVFHIKFGYGEVTGIDGNKLTVQFDKAGEKKVVDSFVQAA